MKRLKKRPGSGVNLFMIPAILLISGLLISGCDFSARWDLRKAEKALKRADKANADFWAHREYQKAQKAFTKAMDEARVRNINNARDLALEAHDWAEEATFLSIRRAEEMQEEKDALNSKKY